MDRDGNIFRIDVNAISQLRASDGMFIRAAGTGAVGFFGDGGLAQALCQRAGRIVWRGLSLRAKVDEAWAMAMPDVFSIRHTTVERYLEPVVHEIKVRRADLLADLRQAAKGAAYCALSAIDWWTSMCRLQFTDATTSNAMCRT